MSCARARDVDLLEFLAEPRAEAFQAFREHYPTCSECAAEVRAWTELELSLRAAHPAPAQLLRYEDERASLSTSERRSLEGHLETCASCRDELSSLRGFDFAAVAAAAPAAERDPFWVRALARLRWVVWQPAFAYALVLVLLVPFLVERFDLLREPTTLPGPFSTERAFDPPELEADSKSDLFGGKRENALEAQEAAPERKRSAARSQEPAPKAPETASSKVAETPEPDLTGAPVPKGAETSSTKKEPAPSRKAVPKVAEAQPPAPATGGRLAPAPERALSPLAQEEAFAVAPSEPPAFASEPLEADGLGALADAEGTSGDDKLRAVAPQAAERRASRWSGLVRKDTDARRAAPVLPLRRDADDWVVVAPLARLQPLAGAEGAERARLLVILMSEDGSRALHEIREVSPLALELELRVPANWLRTGRYRLEITKADPKAARIAFQLEAP